MLLMIFGWFDLRKIDTAFAIFAAAFLGKQIPVHHPANIKQGGNKQYGYYNYLDTHVTKLIHFIHIRIDKRISIWFRREPRIKSQDAAFFPGSWLLALDSHLHFSILPH
jgi:hypothetical protein